MGLDKRECAVKTIIQFNVILYELLKNSLITNPIMTA